MTDAARQLATVDGAASPQPEEPVLTVEGLGRSFRGRDVLSRVDLSVSPGERIALWGPNGSGKTTLLRCIAGTLTAQRGTVSVAGHVAGSLAARRLVGASFAQERSFYLRLSGRNNLLFFARLRYANGADAARAVSALEEELELGQILATRADACSAGMLQQLAVARALLGDPALLLLDEPTRSLDAAAVERLWGAIERRPDVALLLATHHGDDAERCHTRLELPL